MTAYIGTLVYRANIQKKNMEMVKNQKQTLEKAKQDADRWSDMAFDLTSSMLDKRYNDTKAFIGSQGRSGSMKFKKSVSNQQRDTEYFMRQNSLKLRTKYQQTVSQYNQKMSDQKVKTSVRKLDLRSFI